MQQYAATFTSDGLAPSQAMRECRRELTAYNFADSTVNPPSSSVYALNSNLRKEQFGDLSQASMLECVDTVYYTSM